MNLTQHLNADPAAPRWLVALSGGMDSIVLLHSLASLVSQSSGLPPVSAIHVNHQLHPEADAWQAHCDRVCASLGVPLQHSVVSVDGAGEGIEAAARRARYAVFEDSLGEGDVLFMAHHQDDQVETLLLRLLRGAGLSGLGGMPERRPLGAGQLYRPFLGLPRSMLADYAAEQKLDWVDDPSNADSQFDRNYLRAQVIPAVAQRWPGYRQTISRAAANLAEAQALLTQLAPSPLTLRSRTGDPGLAARDLPADDPVRAVHNLRAWLQDQGVMAPEHRMLTEFLRQLHPCQRTMRLSKPDLRGWAPQWRNTHTERRTLTLLLNENAIFESFCKPIAGSMRILKILKGLLGMLWVLPRTKG